MTAGAREYTPGERIQGSVYQVLRKIGSGGMGTVYDVEDTTIGKRYVLKALHPQLGNREDLARRMQNEARVLARLHHPNIVEVITAGVTGDELRLPYYVMERLSGQSLRLVLEKKGQLELAHAYHIAIDLLDALDHAHDKGVIHRDVKPDNIYLHRTNAGVTVTKLLDFGIVSLLDSGPRETAGRFVGTLRYASPEQLRGENPTPKMDLYCAALVLYEMIAGRGPFDDQGDSQQVAAAHLHRPAPPISRFARVPRELEGLLAAALAKLPDGRPRDAFSFAASLRNLKRALAPEVPGEATENRATAPAVVDPMSAAAPFVALRRSSPEGAYVVSPAPSAGPPTGVDAMPRTTVRGMVPPTVGPSVVPESAGHTTATSADAVDRQATTRTFAAAAAAPPPGALGAGGTEGMGAAPLGVTVRAHPLPFTPTPMGAMAPGVMGPSGGAAGGATGADGVAPFRWPSEPPHAPSEGPQVRTLAGEPSGTSRAAVVMAVATVLGLAVVSGGLLFLRHKGEGLRASPSAPVVALPAASASTLPLPNPSPVLAIPAPTLAPPALEDPSSASTAAASASAPDLASKSAHPLPKPRASSSGHAAAPVPAPVPSSAALPADRPGPGF